MTVSNNILTRKTTYSQTITNLESILEEVVERGQIIVIERKDGKNVALIAEEELSSLLESVYLLRSPENAKRLFRALDWSESEVEESQTIEELKEELGIE